MLSLAWTLAACGSDDETKVETPSYLYVYVVNDPERSISAFSVNESTGALTEVLGSPYISSVGGNRIAADPEGRYLYVTGSSQSLIAVWAIHGGDGTLTQVAGSPFTAQFAPTAIDVHPEGHLLFIAKDNPTNQVKGYQIDTNTGKLTAAPGAPAATGTGPFSVAIGPNGDYLYTANDGSGDISAFAIVSDAGTLARLPSDPIAPASAVQPQDLVFDAAGRFAYVADVSVSSVLGMSLNTATGALTDLTPDAFAATSTSTRVVGDPTGQFIYAMDSGPKVHKFKIESDGSLSTRVAYDVGVSHTSIAIDPRGRYLYVLDGSANAMFAFSIKSTTGALTDLGGTLSPVAVGTTPRDVVAVRASP